MLELVPAEIGLNIELKMSCGGRLEEAAIKLLRENGRLDSVLFSSYDHKLLHRIKQQAPEARISLVYDFKPLHPLSLIRDFGLDVFAVSLYHGWWNRKTSRPFASMASMSSCGRSIRACDAPDAGIAGFPASSPITLPC
ncbi:glycerophosphodiester phosphodiesterase [Paenibacillus validus]